MIVYSLVQGFKDFGRSGKIMSFAPFGGLQLIRLMIHMLHYRYGPRRWKLCYMGVSENSGYLFWGPCSKDPTI